MNEPPLTRSRKLDEKFIAELEIEPGEIAIDCGASIGDVTEELVKKGAEVCCFEANPVTFEFLSKRFGSNPSVQCFQKAVSDRAGKARFYLHEDFDGSDEKLRTANGSSLLEFKGNVRKDQPIEVETIDLCAFIESLDREIGLLKIDIEGAEIEVINRLIDTGLYKKARVILAETHERKIPELRVPTQKLRDRIKEMGISNIDLDWI